MIARKHALLMITCTLVILSSLLTACTDKLDEATQDAMDELINLGFGLVVPSVYETEQGTRVHTLSLGPSNLFLIEGADGVVLVDHCLW